MKQVLQSKLKLKEEQEEASEVVSDLKDEDKVEEVDSSPKTIEKQDKNKDLQ